MDDPDDRGFDFFLRDVGRFTPRGLPAVLGIAPPDDLPVRVRGVPDLRAKPSTALTAANLCAEERRTAEVAHLAALLDHLLHLVESRRIDDGLMAVLPHSTEEPRRRS